jgi:hypothetical protein
LQKNWSPPSQIRPYNYIHPYKKCTGTHNLDDFHEYTATWACWL